MTSRKELKQGAVARVQAEKAARRARAEALEAMNPTERDLAKAADKAAHTEAKATAKAARAGMSRPERKLQKRADRIYRKVLHRRRRAIGWGVAGVAVVGIGVIATPYIQDISRLLSIKVDTTTAEGQAARAYGAQMAEAISDEGIVLLQNDDQLLPMSGGVNVFSFASFNLRYGGGGSGGADQSAATTLYDALKGQGIAYNEDLYATMGDAGAETKKAGAAGLMQIVGMLTGAGKMAEPAPDYLTEDVLAQAKGFSDTAMVVIGNDGVEMADFAVDELRITENQKALLDKVTGTFDNVVLVVNSGNQMELGFLKDYPQIKSTVWIGTPGPKGAVSLAKILSGEVNPSGHLTDTYPYDITSSPASVNFGDYKYDNAKRSFLNYNEGIYVGYRFYETYYLDDPAGYDAAVQFPFGYGLSYTDFDWQVSEPVITDTDISVDVEVTNTGTVAGKDVVQAYFSAPYTAGEIEKSAIELGGFAKTDLLEPGATQKVTISFTKRDMASWDQRGDGAYVLDQGPYTLKVATDVHVAGTSFDFEVTEPITYTTDAVTGAELKNRFGYAQGDLSFLSRADFDATFPGAVDRSQPASPELLAAMYPELVPATGDAPTYGADNGILLADLEGLPYDDPKWELFLDQFTKEEQINLFSRGAHQTQAIDRLGVPAAVLLDGPAGLNFFFGNVTAASFPTEVVIASTWNEQLAYDMGKTVGTEANAYGVQGWYAPGMNIHRTPQGGRNFEYYSEDPLVSGKMGMNMVAGAQSQNVLTFMKHFVLNDQETNARSGINIWVNEQALREIYLAPFEITVKEGKATGAMSSFVHLGPVWAGGNPELLQDVLRTEWGFDGVVSTDAVLGSFMDNTQAVRHGNDLMLDPLATNNVRKLTKALETDPVGIGNGLRDRVHTISYALLRTDLLTK